MSKQTIENLKQALDCKTDVELAKILKMPIHSISRWKNKTIGHPAKKLIEIIILQSNFLSKRQKSSFIKELSNIT